MLLCDGIEDSCDNDGVDSVGLGFTRLLLPPLLPERVCPVETVEDLDISLLCRLCDGSHWMRISQDSQSRWDN